MTADYREKFCRRGRVCNLNWIIFSEKSPEACPVCNSKDLEDLS